MLDFTGPSRKKRSHVVFHRLLNEARSVLFLGTLPVFQFAVFHAIKVSRDLKYSGKMDQMVKNDCYHCPTRKKLTLEFKSSIGIEIGG